MIFKKFLITTRGKMDRNNQEICEYIVRLKKEHSSMLYFILESNENIAFYSTLKESSDDAHRDVKISCHISMKQQLDSVLKHFKSKYPMEYIN